MQVGDGGGGGGGVIIVMYLKIVYSLVYMHQCWVH